MNTVFVDSNVLVYSRDAGAPKKREAALRWLEQLWETRAGRVSTQVLQEFYVAATQKLENRIGPAAARADVDSLVAWNPLPGDLSLITSAWDIEDRFGFSFWDAQIVAAAQRSGCSHLLTEDLQDGQTIDGLTVIDPFRHLPESVLG